MKPVVAAPYPWPFDGAWRAADTALLVVDAQRWLLDMLPGLEARIARLLAAARAAALPVLFAARTRPAGVALRRAARATPDALVPEGQGAALAFDVPQHAVIARAGYSAFAGTALDQVLRNAGARNLILCGAVTEGAVHATMREANDRGYECLLVEDACASLDAAHHAAILRITRFGNGLFGCTAPLEAVLEAMA